MTKVENPFRLRTDNGLVLCQKCRQKFTELGIKRHLFHCDGKKKDAKPALRQARQSKEWCSGCCQYFTKLALHKCLYRKNS